MRLIKDERHGNLSLVEYHGDNIPCYAILSHTWGADGEEVTFKDLMRGTGKNKADYKKIEFCRKRAAGDGLQHFWVDTCCIDKSGGAELSEAINSMYRWYQNTDICYIYLSDINTRGSEDDSPEGVYTSFHSSKWFDRGWTLQELLAPLEAVFYDMSWGLVGTRKRASDRH